MRSCICQHGCFGWNVHRLECNSYLIHATRICFHDLVRFMLGLVPIRRFEVSKEGRNRRNLRLVERKTEVGIDGRVGMMGNLGCWWALSATLGFV